MTLKELQIGKSAVVDTVGGTGALRQHFLDMGLVPGAQVTLVKPLPDGTTLTFALAGNQNCGKTTLFNQLTGSNQHVGNFPGVTVDRKSGAIKGHPETEVTDLPGIYSMSPYSSEEIVTRQFIIGEKPTGIINIVDATNIERNLYQRRHGAHQQDGIHAGHPGHPHLCRQKRGRGRAGGPCRACGKISGAARPHGLLQ